MAGQRRHQRLAILPTVLRTPLPLLLRHLLPWLRQLWQALLHQVARLVLLLPLPLLAPLLLELLQAKGSATLQAAANRSATRKPCSTAPTCSARGPCHQA